MTRHCLLLDLVDDPELIAEYRQWHAPGGPPAAVTRSIREARILDMQIWQAGGGWSWSWKRERISTRTPTRAVTRPTPTFRRGIS